jgi:hypothetical protein
MVINKPVHSQLHLYKVSTAESSSGCHSTVISTVPSLHFRFKWLSLLKTTAQESLKYMLSDKYKIQYNRYNHKINVISVTTHFLQRNFAEDTRLEYSPKDQLP